MRARLIARSFAHKALLGSRAASFSAEALVHYRADMDIAEKLAARDPSNALWAKDLAISRARMQRLEGK